ncbi:MAG TPA: hypothetical protein VK597_12870 [Inquilinus sp.]|nr:hypothetical protein [Inquilinus sp.]
MDFPAWHGHIGGMSEGTDNLVPDLLRAVRADVSAIRETLGEHGHRLYRIETGLAGVRREVAGDAEDIAHLGARIDRLREELDQIKRRLDITEA